MADLEKEYREFKALWLAGERDREVALRLMFLAWWHWAEPSFLTGLIDDSDAVGLWQELFAHLGGKKSKDTEFLFVAGIMAQVFAYPFADDKIWERRGSKMIKRAMKKQPAELPLSTFEHRGEYGEYFGHQLRGHLKSRKNR